MGLHSFGLRPVLLGGICCVRCEVTRDLIGSVREGSLTGEGLGVYRMLGGDGLAAGEVRSLF
jgi:hypothetical protein